MLGLQVCANRAWFLRRTFWLLLEAGHKILGPPLGLPYTGSQGAALSWRHQENTTQVDRASRFLPVCHYWIVFFSTLVSPGLSLLLRAQHESTRTHTNVPLSSSFNFTVKMLVSRKRAANLPAFSPSSVRNSRGLSCRSSGSQAAISPLLEYWCLFSFAYVLFCVYKWDSNVGFQSTKLLVRRQGVQAWVEGF